MKDDSMDDDDDGRFYSKREKRGMGGQGLAMIGAKGKRCNSDHREGKGAAGKGVAAAARQ